MSHWESTANGEANFDEYGSIKTEKGFKALHAVSSYHHVKDGMRYPAILLTTGITDPRGDPWESAKMAAGLQSASASGKPILLRVDYEAGQRELPGVAGRRAKPRDVATRHARIPATEAGRGH